MTYDEYTLYRMPDSVRLASYSTLLRKEAYELATELATESTDPESCYEVRQEAAHGTETVIHRVWGGATEGSEVAPFLPDTKEERRP